MSKPIIVFGDRDNAEMAKFYFGHRVIGFTKHSPEIDSVFNLPMYDFNTIQTKFSPDDVEIFAPLNDNFARAKVYDEIKDLGYTLPTFIHPTAHVWDRDAIGDNCFIQELNNVQYGTTVGNNVIMWAGNHVGHHGIIEDHVFLSSHVVISGHCHIHQYCWLGVNSTIRDHVTLTYGTTIGAASNVTKSLTGSTYSTYVGNPAKRFGNVG